MHRHHHAFVLVVHLFHAEPVALACDYLATAIAEIGALSERRIALLIENPAAPAASPGRPSA